MKITYEIPDSVPKAADYDSPAELAIAEQRYLDDCRDFLAHEGFNVYAAQGIKLPYPWPTWWILEEQTVKNLYEGNSELFADMAEKLKVKPAVIQTESGPKDCIFASRYELITYKAIKTGAGFRHRDAVIDSNDPLTAGWVDFVSGLPYGVMEQKLAVWEVASYKYLQLWEALVGEGVVPPFPEELFAGYPEETSIFKLMWLDEEKVEGLAKNLEGQQDLELLWWWRINYQLLTLKGKDKKYPTPGEFMAMAPRMIPYLPWGWQKTSPWLFSGNWLDTVYFTRGRIHSIIESNDTVPFQIYKVAWRGKEGTYYEATGSGFENYEVGDWVTILKNIGTNRTSQTWKDDQDWAEGWRLAPISFYELTDDERQAEEDSYGSL